MVRYAAGLAEAGQFGIGSRMPIEFDLDAHLAEPIVHELQLDGGEEVLLLGASPELEEAMAREVAPNRLQRAESPHGTASSRFDLVLFNLPAGRGDGSSAKVHTAAESLRPGGRLVLVAQDPRSLALSPEVEGFAPLWDSYLAGNHSSPLEGTDLEELALAAGMCPRSSSTLHCSCQSRPSISALGLCLITSLCGAREQIQARMGMSSQEFASSIRAVQRWREHPDASVRCSTQCGVSLRRMREYLTLLPGAELAYSAI